MTEELQNDKTYEFNSTYDVFNVVNYADLYMFDPSMVKLWLKDHNRFNQQIRTLSRRLYNSNGIYARSIDFRTSLPSLNRIVYSINRSHSRYQSNKSKFISALKKMKDKQVARDILHKLGLDGTAFYYFESTSASSLPQFLSDEMINLDTEINATDFNCGVIPLPTDYCRIVGTRNSSYVMAFDLSYFDQYLSNGLSKKLMRYPKEIRSKYNIYRRDMANNRWVVLDNNNTIVVKSNSKTEDKWGRPLGLSAFIDMLYDGYYVETKRNLLDEVNSTIFYQTFPEGEKKGKSSLTKDQQKSQHDNLKNALFTKGKHQGVNFVSLAAGTKLDKVQTNLDFLQVKSESELIKRISTDLGFASSALNGQDGNFSSSQTNIELISSEVFACLEQVQEEFNKVINANIIKDNQVYMEIYYLPVTHANRKEKVDEMQALYTSGRGSLQAWIASTGFDPEAYLSLMEEEVEQKFDDKFPVHLTSHTISGNDLKGGRQPNDLPTNENTIKSKTNGDKPRPN